MSKHTLSRKKWQEFDEVISIKPFNIKIAVQSKHRHYVCEEVPERYFQVEKISFVKNPDAHFTLETMKNLCVIRGRCK